MSSISGINLNSSAIPSGGNSGANAFRQDLKALQTSLQTGDLSGAQSAFTSLSTSLQSNASGPAAISNTSSTATGGNSAIKDDLRNIQSALQSGDINSAKTAFTKLKTDLHGVGGHHHHGGKPAVANSDANSLLDSLLSSFSSSSPTTANTASNSTANVDATSIGNAINQLT